MIKRELTFSSSEESNQIDIFHVDGDKKKEKKGGIAFIKSAIAVCEKVQ